MLEFTDRKLGQAEVVAVKGRLDSATAGLLAAHCGGLPDDGFRCVVFDFTDLQFLSSAGLRTILGLSKRIRAAGGKLVFTGIRGPIRDMFDIAGFLEVFPVVDQVETGLA